MRVDDPVEMEAGPAEIVDGLFESDARIEKQLPRGPGHDEREGERIEIERPQDAFASNLLIEKDREQQSEREAEDDIEAAEEPHIHDRRVPVRWRIALERPGPELLVIRPADEIEIGESLGVRERKQQGPEIEPVDKEKDQQRRKAPRTSLGSKSRKRSRMPPPGTARNRNSDGLGRRCHRGFLRAARDMTRGSDPPPPASGGG